MKLIQVQIKWALPFLLIILGLLVGLVFDIKPHYTHLKKYNQDILAMRLKLKSENNMVQQNKTLMLQKDDLVRSVNPYSRNADFSAMSSEVVTRLLQASEISGLQIQSIQPIERKNLSGVVVVSMRLVAKGNFFQFAKFNFILSQHLNPIEINEMTMRSIAPLGELDIHMEISGFFIESTKANQAMIEEIASPALKLNLKRDPFTLVSDEVFDYHLLKNTPLEQIKFVGYIEKDKQFSALAMLPNKKTVEVNPNMSIGTPQAKVIQLNDHEIVLSLSSRKLHLKYAF